MRYCISVKKVIERTEKIIVNADSATEALDKAYNASETGKIDFGDCINDEEYYDCEIDSYSAIEDDTFDKEQFCDYGMQIID